MFAQGLEDLEQTNTITHSIRMGDAVLIKQSYY